MVFLAVMYGCESWIIKKAERQRTDAFKLWGWRRLLRVPWTARKSNQSILKEINPEYLLKGLMLKLKLQYFRHLMRKAIHWKRFSCWERLRAGSWSSGVTGLISLLSKGLSRVFSSPTVWKHQFFSAQPSLWSNCHIHTWLLEKPLLRRPQFCDD